MTTHFEEEKTCAVCRTDSQYTEIGSTNAFGSSDLDTRPPEMQRSTIFAWVQRCPKCGYCATDVGEAAPTAIPRIHTPAYTNQLIDSTYPELANSFLCKALIDDDSKDYAAAAWSMIHAAWACDDAKSDGPAKECRIKAAAMIRKSLDNGQQIAGQDGADTAILVDLLRRAGCLDKAQQLIITERPAITEDIILEILAFQETLIANSDDACHTISEALGENH